ncbi:MAG: hypothetical protein AAGF12_26175 [Myxococcota bacterium]
MVRKHLTLVALLLAAFALAPSNADAQGVGGYVSMEWRALGVAGHFSHGPGASAGIRLFDGVFRVGIAGWARPGPINPETFEVVPSGGGTYKGQSTLELRSDGGVIGLELALDLAVPGVPWLHLLPSFTVSNAAFGFYLTGDDRDTPDGRRVSEWENELQDGRDASPGVGLDVGLRVAFDIPGSPVRPVIGGGYFLIVGYDAYAEDNYSGPWATAGVEVLF